MLTSMSVMNSASVVAHSVLADGTTGPEHPGINPPLPPPDSIRYALRDAQGHLLAGDGQVPPVAMNDLNAQVFAISQIDGRSLRTLKLPWLTE